MRGSLVARHRSSLYLCLCDFRRAFVDTNAGEPQSAAIELSGQIEQVVPTVRIGDRHGPKRVMGESVVSRYTFSQVERRVSHVVCLRVAPAAQFGTNESICRRRRPVRASSVALFSSPRDCSRTDGGHRGEGAERSIAADSRAGP